MFHYDERTETWTNIGKIKKARRYHALVALDLSIVCPIGWLVRQSLCNCALCLTFNCYSPACIVCLCNFHLHILQSAHVAVLPLEWTGNAAHHRHVKGITKETLQQQMGVSNFANNSHSAFTGFLNQSLLYHNILHHQVWRQWNSATGARQCMFIERPKPYGPPYTGPPPTDEIHDDDSVSGSCGDTWWYGRLGGTKNTNFQNSIGALSNPISFAIRISKQFLFSF